MKHLSVLFVDDQKTLLNAVERIVRKQAKDWDVHFSDSAASAIEILKTHTINVVVSDMRMPEMDGVELLDHVKDEYPNIIRFILSGYSKTDRTLDAVRVAHQYFIKPFSTKELIDALELTHTLYKRIRNPGLQGIIASIDRLPTPRKIYYEISTELNNPHTTIEKISTIIASDTAITGKVLQVVNSAFFGRSQRVDSIDESVGILGLEAVRSLVLVAGIASDHAEILNGLISIDLYSRHCMEVALLCRWISKELGYSPQQRDTLFTVGLLHDIGKLILIKKYSEFYLENGWKEDPYKTKLHITQIEKLADDHAAIGAALIALWGIPTPIVNTIAYYAEPAANENDEDYFSCILHVADGISNYLHNCNDASFMESNCIDLESLHKAGFDFPFDQWFEEIKLNGVN